MRFVPRFIRRRHPLRFYATVGKGRWWRWPVLIATSYVAVAVVGNAVVIGSTLVVEVTGPEVVLDEPDLPRIRNFRRVDDKLYSGAQPTNEAFADLAELGVTLVVDLRTGDLGDPILDDPEFLATLGVEYLPLPLTDGHAPPPELVARFFEAVEENDGAVYMHCGGGVGRSGALQAAYLNATGDDFSVPEYLAVGPPTVEQLYYVWRGEPGDLPESNVLVATLSRFVIDGPRTLLTWGRGLITG